MSFDTDPRPLHTEGKFLVQIPDMQDLKFEKCSEIKGTISQLKRTMGGENHPRKYPGNVEFADVTLEHGKTSDTRLRDWFNQCQDAIAQRGQVAPKFFKDVSIVQYDADMVTVLERNILQNAWPCELDEGGWDAENKNFRVGKVVICYWQYETIKG